METNMTTEKAFYILLSHNMWRRGADYIEATDPELLGMALDKAIEVLRVSRVSDSLLPEDMEVIDAYLNAGCKETRKEASKKAKVLYEKYTGKEYKNRNER